MTDPLRPATPPPDGYTVPQNLPQNPGQLGYDPLVSQDFGGWWERGMAVVRLGWRKLALLQSLGVVAVLLVNVPTTIKLHHLKNSATSADSASALDTSAVFAVLGYTLLSLFVTIMVSYVIALAAIHLSMAIVTGTTPKLGTAIRGAGRRVFALLGWQLAAGLLLLVGACACILPALFFAAVFTMLPTVVAFERGHVIRRCFQLFLGDRGAAAARAATMLGLAVAGGAAGMLVGSLFTALAAGLVAGPTGVLLGAVTTTVLSAVVTGAVAVVTTPLTLVTYADLRARIEPCSTGLLATELGLNLA